MANENLSSFKEKIKNLTDEEKIVSSYIEYRNYLVSINPERALYIIKEGYKRFEYSKNQDLKYRLLLNWASTLIILEQFKEALEKMYVCLQYFHKKNNRKLICSTIGNTAVIFLRLEMYSYAKYLWKVVLAKYIDINDRKYINLSLNNVLAVNMMYFHRLDHNEIVIEDLIRYYSNRHDLSRQELYTYFFTIHNQARFYNLKKDYFKAITILEKLVLDCERHGFETQKIDIYYELGVLYKQINNEQKMVSAFKNVIKIGDQMNIKLLYSKVYEKLYEFYKTTSDYKKALAALEKFNVYKNIEVDLKRNINLTIKELELDNKFIKDKNMINIFKNDNIESDLFIFIENLDEKIIKIEIMDIVCVKKENSFIVITLSNSEVIESKMNFKSLFNTIQSLTPQNNMFFESNSRGTLINTFWISKIDIDAKKVSLRPFYKEFEVIISKRNWTEFKKMINK